MSLRLKPYPEYKDSGVPWLGKIPAHWGTRRGKGIFQCIDVRSSTIKEQLFTFASNRGLLSRHRSN